MVLSAGGGNWSILRGAKLATSWGKRESLPDGSADKGQLAQGRASLTGGRALARISVIHRETRERDESAPQRLQCRFVWQQKREKLIQVVRSWNNQADLLKERLEVLLGRLLAVETDEVIQWRLAPRQLACAPGIGLGLANPSRRQPVHKAPYPL